MNEAQQAADLANAIMERAQGFAADYQAQAQQAMAKIQSDAKHRLVRLEAREQEAAKIEAERLFKRLVQAGELRLQAELDALRWQLLNTVMQRLRAELQQHTTNAKRYLPLLKELIFQAAEEIEQEKLIAEVNPHDYARLEADWQPAVKGKHIDLACKKSASWLGGAIVYSADRRIRLDNTLDGRLQQRENELYQVILSELFPAGDATTRQSGS